jgi:hypothetical protein
MFNLAHACAALIDSVVYCVLRVRNLSSLRFENKNYNPPTLGVESSEGYTWGGVRLAF